MAYSALIARVLALLVAGLLLLGAVRCSTYAILGGRNDKGFGNEAFESERQKCRVPGAGATVRFYRGKASGLDPYWYSVTVQRATLGRERQIFYSSWSPWIDSIVCGPTGVRLVGQLNRTQEFEQSFTLAVIDSSSVKRPVVFVWGEVIDSPESGAKWLFRGVALFCALVLLALAIVTIQWARRGSPPKGLSDL